MEYDCDQFGTDLDLLEPIEQQSMTPDELEARRNFFVAGEVLRAEKSTIDVDAEYRKFMSTHQPSEVAPTGPILPIWLKVVRYALIAAAVVAIAVIITRPKTTKQSTTPLVAKVEKGLVYKADAHPGHVALTRSNGTIVQLPVNELKVMDALDLATTSEKLTITIPKGSSYQVNLADGSRVYLNADSRLTFPTKFAGPTRTVELDGEAYFDVAHDATRPFVVETGQTKTTVLGTEFYIKANTNEPQEVTLIRGRVKVETPKQSLIITPGEQAQIAADGMQTVLNTDVDHYTYWRDGFLYYDNTDLMQVMCAIGRNYNYDVEFLDTSLLHYKIHFVVERSKNIDEVVQTLNQMERVKVRKEGNKLVVF